MAEWKVAPSYQKMKLVKVDEVNHKGLVEEKCWKCGGSGEYAWFGTCFACNGAGCISKWVKIYTEEEYEKYVAAQEKAKEKREQKAEADRQDKLDNSEKYQAEVLEKLGYDTKNPLIWLVGGGSTYEIKDQLKEAGCKFNPVFGWYSTKPIDVPTGYGMVSINFYDVYVWYPFVKRFELKENAKEIADTALAKLTPESHSEYIGEVKERLRDLQVTLTAVRNIDGFYGTSYIYTFKKEENVLVWITSSYKDIQIGHIYSLTGTVKEHKEYKNVKQTVLSRCIVKESGE